MPIVPKVNRQGLGGGFDTNVSAISFGSGQGIGAIGDAARSIQDEISRQKKEADQSRVDDAEAQAIRKKINRTHGGKDETGRDQVGYFSTKGIDSEVEKPNFVKGFDDDLNEIESGLSDSQKEMFRSRRQKLELDYFSSLENHSFKEREAYADESFKSSVSTITQDAVLNFKDEGKVGTSRLEILKRANDRADALGLEGETRGQFVKSTATRFHTDVISRMATDDNLENADEMALGYFDAIKGEMTADDILKTEKFLNEVHLQNKSQRLADEFFDKSGGDVGSALKLARQEKDPETRQELERKIKIRHSDTELAKRQDAENRMQSATNIIEKTKDFDGLKKTNPTLFNKLELAERKALRSYADDLRSGREITTNSEVYYDLYTMATTPALASEFTEKNLLELRGQLSNSDFKKFVDMQADLRVGTRGEKTEEFLSAAKLFDNEVEVAGIDPRPSGDSDKRKLAELRLAYDKALDKEQRSIGRNLSNEEKGRVLRGLLVEAVTKRKSIFGIEVTDKKRVFEIPEGEDLAVEVEDIPAKERSQVEDALIQLGREVTEQNIFDLYNEYLRRRRSGAIGKR